MLLFLVTTLCVVTIKGCYWRSDCPYGRFASRTPYDSVRGDIRDYPIPENCEAVSIWSISRHGNRNPGDSTTTGMRQVAQLKDEILASYDAGNSQLCAQDIDELRKWTWNSTLDDSINYLTGTGYEELYKFGKRIRQKYPHLLEGTEDDYYFRPTNEQRTIVSSVAYVHGLTDGINLDVNIDSERERDDVIRPYENCDRYQQEVRSGQVLADQLDSYFNTPEYTAIRQAVQERLGISTILTVDDVFSIYELCRFYRTWSEIWRDPWCAAFTTEDLLVLEYYDDVRHYYRNGYGSWINVHLGQMPLKDLYDNFEATVQGQGKKIVSYFSHATMLEMVISAMGLYKDPAALQSTYVDPNRLWRSSFIGVFSVNVMGVLNRCNEGGSETYRVQLFINEKETLLCPLEGCSWAEFQQKFQQFSFSTLNFCSMD